MTEKHLKPIVKWSGGKGDEIKYIKNIYQNLPLILNHLLEEVHYIFI